MVLYSQCIVLGLEEGQHTPNHWSAHLMTKAGIRQKHFNLLNFSKFALKPTSEILELVKCKSSLLSHVNELPPII